MADLEKIADDLSGLTVLEAAELSKLLEEKWGVSAAAPVAVAAVAAGAGGDAAAAEEKDSFDVMRSQNHRAGAVPYGWDPSPSADRTSKTGRQADDLIPNPSEQETLTWILEQSKTYGDTHIARALNAAEIPSKKGGQWYPSTVKSVREHARLAAA